MKKTAKIISGLLFAPVLMLVIMLWTLQFQLLNPDFVLGSLENAKVYDRIPETVQASLKEKEAGLNVEDKIRFQAMADQVTPELSRDVIGTNVKVLTAYFNGNADEFYIYLPISKIGVPKDQIPPELLDDKMDANELSSDGSFSGALYNAKNIDGIIRPAMIAGIVIIISLAILYARLSRPWTGVHTLFLGSGISLVITSIIAQVFFYNATRDLLSATSDPSQIIIGLLFSSVLKDIVITWLYAGTGLILIGIVLLVIQKKLYKQPRAVNKPGSAANQNT